MQKVAQETIVHVKTLGASKAHIQLGVLCSSAALAISSTLEAEMPVGHIQIREPMHSLPTRRLGPSPLRAQLDDRWLTIDVPKAHPSSAAHFENEQFFLSWQ